MSAEFALKPSLEGWKLDGGGKSTLQWTGLETFLRGMETHAPLRPTGIG